MSAAAPTVRLPAVQLQADGRRTVDLRAVFVLALPLFLNSSVQVVLNLTDTWFVGRISAEATAGVGACYWLIVLFLLLGGGIGMGLQTLVAQAYGGGERRQAARLTWSAFWLCFATIPFFGALAGAGAALLHPFGLAPAIDATAVAFWQPRMWGGPLTAALWVFTSFFNGIGRTRVTLLVMVLTALTNFLLNGLFIRGLHFGVAGSGLATSCAQAIGVLTGLAAFLGPRCAREFGSRGAWLPSAALCLRVLALGIPTGLFPAVDVIGYALFLGMMSRIGAVDGAASQLVMMLTSIAYMPAIGIGLAGTTLVGQCIGAGDPAWAMKLGTRTIFLGAAYMGGLGLLLALFGAPVLALFLSPTDPLAAPTLSLARPILWIAAAYQLFDGINMVSAFCLRGAGDVRLPTLLVLVACFGVFIPLTHALAFAPGQGYVDFLPQLGWGAVGGWTAALIYIVLVSAILYARWRSGAWKQIQV